MSNITENDVKNLINYMKAIIQLISFCIAIKPDYKKILAIDSSLIAQRLRKKIMDDSALKELGPLGLQVNLHEHIKNANVISPNSFFFDVPIVIDKEKYDAYLARVFSTPMATGGSVRARMSHSLPLQITYQDIYEGKHKDSVIVSMLNALGDPYTEGGFGGNEFELIVANLLKSLQLNNYDGEKNLDYAGLKFYLMTDLLHQFVNNLKATAEYIWHHYNVAYLWYRMASQIFKQETCNPSEAITDEVKQLLVKTMNDLTGSIESFWKEFLALKHLSTDIEIKKIYDNYTNKTHEALESKNNGLKEKVKIFESTLQKIQQWQTRFLDHAALIPATSDQEVGGLLFLLLKIHTKLTHNHLSVVKNIGNCSILIIEKLKTMNPINDEMEKKANQNTTVPDDFSSTSVNANVGNERSKSFSS